jgi:hypothetical protein
LTYPKKGGRIGTSKKQKIKMENADTQETQCRVCWCIKEKQKVLNKMKDCKEVKLWKIKIK